MSINTVANRGGMKLIRSSILDEIAFPKDYLTGDRLKVKQNAKPGNLEAVIAARQRPTSLARFAASTSLGSRARIGVRVRLKKSGGETVLKQAWLTRLRNGNIGLAVRVKSAKLAGKYDAIKTWLVPDKVALLYGPSVDQVFRDVSHTQAAPIGRMVTEEFFRQFTRLTK